MNNRLIVLPRLDNTLIAPPLPPPPLFFVRDPITHPSAAGDSAMSSFAFPSRPQDGLGAASRRQTRIRIGVSKCIPAAWAPPGVYTTTSVSSPYRTDIAGNQLATMHPVLLYLSIRHEISRSADLRWPQKVCRSRRNPGPPLPLNQSTFLIAPRCQGLFDDACLPM